MRGKSQQTLRDGQGSPKIVLKKNLYQQKLAERGSKHARHIRIIPENDT
jgi:hypothetical protein